MEREAPWRMAMFDDGNAAIMASLSVVAAIVAIMVRLPSFALAANASTCSS